MSGQLLVSEFNIEADEVESEALINPFGGTVRGDLVQIEYDPRVMRSPACPEPSGSTSRSEGAIQMSKEIKTPDVDRRDFLHAAAAAAAGGVCFTSATIRQALAAARQSGKPLFTAANFNAAFPKQHDEKFRGLMGEVKADVRAFIRRQFYLTKEQERELASLPQEIVRDIQASAADILERKATVELTIVRGDERRQPRDVSAGQGYCNYGYWYECKTYETTDKYGKVTRYTKCYNTYTTCKG